jgi:hypothetical protein
MVMVRIMDGALIILLLEALLMAKRYMVKYRLMIEVISPIQGDRGRLIPTTSVDQYAATLGGWFGLDQSELNDALPNLNNFSEKNLGFI